MDHSVFTHPTVSGHLGCIHPLASVHAAAANKGVQISLEDPAFNSSVAQISYSEAAKTLKKHFHEGNVDKRMRFCVYMKDLKPLITTWDRVALRFISWLFLTIPQFPTQMGGKRCEFLAGNCSSALPSMLHSVPLSSPVSLFWPKKSKRCLVPADRTPRAHGAGQRKGGHFPLVDSASSPFQRESVACLQKPLKAHSSL